MAIFERKNTLKNITEVFMAGISEINPTLSNVCVPIEITTKMSPSPSRSSSDVAPFVGKGECQPNAPHALCTNFARIQKQIPRFVGTVSNWKQQRPVTVSKAVQQK